MSHSESVLELGKKLVAQLDLNDSTDTLARWMAHYISEKIKDVDDAPVAEKSEKMSACCDEILKLWAHRTSFPNGKRPFRDFEPVFRALESLDPSSSSRRFYLLTQDEELGDSEETRHWLTNATCLDKSARLLIRYCLANAAQTSINKESEWVKLATKTSSISADDLRVIAEIASYLKEVKPKTPEEKKRASLEELIRELDELNKLATEMKEHLRKELDEKAI